ncbi:MAG: competence/damage-inducible protein A [Paludibacteraceae bacterium]|nr:competence/damage-inducible protein A [Paludibacteraceae bacterium]
MSNLVEIITIGDEILIGQIVDTNSAWMAKELNKDGFRVFQITTVADDEAHITKAIDDALGRVDIVLVTGGLGPTKDDITKLTLCKYFNTELVFDNAVLENIEQLFKGRSIVINNLTHDQAYVPRACTVIQNRVGTAPVTWFEKEGKVLVSMPGVPHEMEWVMSNETLPRLRKHFNTPAIMHHTMLVTGYGESALAIKIADWEDALPSFIKLAYLPSPGLVKLRLTGSLENKKELANIIDEQAKKVHAILGSDIMADEDIPLEEVIGRLLKEKGLKLATAESCTGGNIAHLITTISGSSNYFKGSVVAYSNEIKQQVLGVSSADLEKFGAVSQSVVEQMAQGVLKLTGADIAVSTSGIAGPTGGTAEKPVGTIWVAVCTRNKLVSREFHFGNIRSRNVAMATLSAFTMLKEMMEA